MRARRIQLLSFPVQVLFELLSLVDDEFDDDLISTEDEFSECSDWDEVERLQQEKRRTQWRRYAERQRRREEIVRNDQAVASNDQVANNGPAHSGAQAAPMASSPEPAPRFHGEGGSAGGVDTQRGAVLELPASSPSEPDRKFVKDERLILNPPVFDCASRDAVGDGGGSTAFRVYVRIAVGVSLSFSPVGAGWGHFFDVNVCHWWVV